MARRLDHSRPYGHVHGLPGVAFAQDGHYFHGNGDEVPDPDAPAADTPVPVPVASISDPGSSTTAMSQNTASNDAAKRDIQTAVSALSWTAQTSVVDKDDMRLKENKALKAQIEAYGETWQGTAHARKFLEGASE